MDRFRDVIEVALKPVLRAGANRQRQGATALRAQEGRALERHLELVEDQARELERLGDREESEVDRYVRAQEEAELAADVEDGQRVAGVGKQVGEQLVQTDLAVAVQVRPQEVNVGGDPTFDAE